MLKRFSGWVGMSIHTRWWLRNCLKNAKHENNRRMSTVRWPTISMSLLSGPGFSISVDCLVCDRSCAGVTPTSCSPTVSVDATVYLRSLLPNCGRRPCQSPFQLARPLWACPRSILLDNGLSSARNPRTLFTSFLEFSHSPSATTTPTATAVWRASITRRRKFWPLSSLSIKMIGVRNFLMLNFRTNSVRITAATGLTSHRGPHGQPSTPLLRNCQTRRSRRTADFVARSARIL